MQVARITPAPTDDEAVAIVTAVTLVLEAEQAKARVVAAARRAHDDTLHLWVEASRRSAQRASLQRGPWRLSGRLPRRSRV